METTIKKNQTVTVQTKTGKNYSYTYVDMAQIHEYLEENNMKYIQSIKRIDTDDYIMTKRCINDQWEDEWIQGCRVVQATLQGSSNPAQEQGSAITFARRYSVQMAFGLATEDDDANCLTREKPTAPAKPKARIPETREEAEQLTISFGKHKGTTLGDIYEIDPGYFDYIVNNSTDEDILKGVELISGQRKMTEEEATERMNKIVKIMSYETKGQDISLILKNYKVNGLNEMTDAQIEDCIINLRKKFKEEDGNITK